MQKTILQWTSKVQYNKGTPSISLIKHLSQQYSMSKGNNLVCKLVIEKEKLKVVVELE
jgi:hypothetical protein